MVQLARIGAVEAARASLAIPEHVNEQLAAAYLHQTLWVCGGGGGSCSWTSRR